MGTGSVSGGNNRKLTKQLTTQQKLMALLALFGLTVILAAFLWGANVVIDFFASIVTGTGITGSFALHHGLIGFIVFLISAYAMLLYRNDSDRTKFTVAGFFALIGLLLMLNDIGDFPKWFLFVH
jgi:hypothetical protein